MLPGWRAVGCEGDGQSGTEPHDGKPPTEAGETRARVLTYEATLPAFKCFSLEREINAFLI